MFSLSRLGLCSGQQIASGVRFFTKAVTQREIFDTLEKEHTIHTIPAFRREGDGKNISRFLRKNGAIPGVLYGPDGKGHDERVLVYVPTSEVDRFMTRLNLSFESTLFYLDVEGERTLVFPRQLSCHPGILFFLSVIPSHRTSRITQLHPYELREGNESANPHSVL